MPTAASSSFACASASRATSSGDLAHGMSGWRRMVPVAVQGASSRTASNGAGPPLQRVGDDDLGVHRQPAQIAHQELGASRRALERGDVGTRGGELGGLAAGCRAEVEHAPALDLAQQPRRQGGGGILHPPGALVVAGQGVDQPAAAPAQRAGRQDLGPQLSAQRSGSPATDRSSGGSPWCASAIARACSSP